MVTEEELRSAMTARLAPALQTLSPAPDLLERLRQRRARHQRRTLAAATIAIVAIVGGAVTAVLEQRDSVDPMSPVMAPTSGPVVPLVTSGPCAGLTLLAQPRPPLGPEHRITPGADRNLVAFTGLMYLKGQGPCVDRLRYRITGSPLQGAGPNIEFHRFYDGIGVVISRPEAAGRGTVEVFLSCSGPGCPEKAERLALITVDVAYVGPGVTQTPQASPAASSTP